MNALIGLMKFLLKRKGEMAKMNHREAFKRFTV